MYKTKLTSLQNRIMNLGSLAVAFSGGVDSTFLLKVAHEMQGNRAVGISERSKFYEAGVMECVDLALKEIGYAYVTLDLKGYRTGSMNEVL